MVAAVREPHPGKQRLRALAGRLSPQLQGHLHVLQRGERRDQVEGLEDEAHLLAAHRGALVLAEQPQLLAVQQYAAAGGLVEAREQGQQRALAAPGGADDGHEAAVGKIERDTFQDREGLAPREVVPSERPAAQDGVRGVHDHGPLVAPSGMIPGKPAGVVAIAASLAASAAGCGSPSRQRASPTPAPKASPDDRSVVLFLGTSLTAGYGLDPTQAYPALVQQKIDAAGLRYRVVNAGVSGETSAGALARIDWVLRQPVAVLVVETGANDAIRGVDTEAVRSNVRAILERARRREPPPRIILAGMRALVNMGADYGKRFRRIYPELARESGVVLVPFLLKGVAGVRDLNQDDGVHPTAEGQRLMADTVWTYLEPLLSPSS